MLGKASEFKTHFANTLGKFERFLILHPDIHVIDIKFSSAVSNNDSDSYSFLIIYKEESA